MQAELARCSRIPQPVQQAIIALCGRLRVPPSSLLGTQRGTNLELSKARQWIAWQLRTNRDLFPIPPSYPMIALALRGDRKRHASIHDMVQRVASNPALQIPPVLP